MSKVAQWQHPNQVLGEYTKENNFNKSGASISRYLRRFDVNSIKMTKSSKAL